MQAAISRAVVHRRFLHVIVSERAELRPQLVYLVGEVCLVCLVGKIDAIDLEVHPNQMNQINEINQRSRFCYEAHSF